MELRMKGYNMTRLVGKYSTLKKEKKDEEANPQHSEDVTRVQDSR